MTHLFYKAHLASFFLTAIPAIAMAQTGTEGGSINPTIAPASSAIKNKAAQFEGIDKHNLVMDFDKNKSTLSAADKSKLNDLLKVLPSETKRLKLTIAAWSDKPFPIMEKVKLKAADEKLADKRIDAVVKYMKNKVKFDTIERVNMAKQANPFASYFSTDDAKLKAAFEGDATEKPWVSYEAKQFRDNGGISKAVLVIYDKVGLED